MSSAAAGSDERVALGKKLGADHGINYNTHNICDEVLRITGGKGVDVLYDNIANPTVLPVAFQAIGMDGRLVTAGAHAGPNVSINFSHLYHKRITIKGRPGYTPSDLPHCLEAAAQGKVIPQIERVLPLSRAADAHRMVEEHEGQGKIVLDPTLGMIVSAALFEIAISRNRCGRAIAGHCGKLRNGIFPDIAGGENTGQRRAHQNIGLDMA